MKIEQELKLDFSDVLIRPKRSTLSSRSEVELLRTFIFLNKAGQVKKEWTGIPIMAANMDTTGTFEMYYELSKFKMITCFHKHYTVEDYPIDLNPDYYAISSGITDNDWVKLRKTVEKLNPTFVCIDVANGYMLAFANFVKKVSENYPNLVIICGNVVSREMVEELIINCGADIVKCGIGSGCFSEDTKVLMANGTYRNINKVKVDEYVINKDGKPVKVLNVMNQGEKDVLKITTNNWHNDIFVTKNHEYWIGDLSTSSYESVQRNGIAKMLDKQAKTKPKSSKYKWNSIDNIDNKKMFTLMPKNIEWQLPENFSIDLLDFHTKGNITENTLETSGTVGKSLFNRHIQSRYKLGYIFGTYLGDGNSRLFENSSGACHWSFALHETDIANKVKDYIKELIDYDCNIVEKDDKVLSVNCYNKCLSKMFFEFGKRIDKQLPSKFYCTNKEYIQGLFDGLIDSDGNIDLNKSGSSNKTLTNTSEYIIELFNWCCINLDISFCSMKKKKTIGNLKGTCVENLQQGYAIKTHTLNRYTKDYVYSTLQSKEISDIRETWDIEVDCPTHSFIANNSIVHNSVCLTRTQTGVGMPQLSCIMECGDAAHGVNGKIISDGGCVHPGDLSKAFGANSDFIMLGSILAGHTESGGELVEENGVKYKMFYGMSSKKAMEKYSGGMASHRSSEGKVVKMPYKGEVCNTIENILGGIRSTCTYIGAKTLKDMPKCTTFMRVTNQINNSLNKYNS
jgi:IMP dehydrogenase/GMP reductase